MSEMSDLAHELRTIAGNDGDWVAGPISASVLREAADTIEGLRDRLQESERHNRINLEVMGEMCHPEIVELMQECHATRANYEHCKYSTNRGWRDTSRYSELFGTTEKAARTLARMCAISDGSCAGCPMYKANLEHCKRDYTHLKSIVEWLRGDAE